LAVEPTSEKVNWFALVEEEEEEREIIASNGSTHKT
jgi:hypothetical protein